MESPAPAFRVDSRGAKGVHVCAVELGPGGRWTVEVPGRFFIFGFGIVVVAGGIWWPCESRRLRE